MVYISRLKLRNFKSFKAADVQLSPSFVCFAGPNGSGKSNLCDAIRFAMGETSLKSLRAKKVRELLHAGSKSAEVTLVFESNNGSGEDYEIKRAIREDGKILYRLNGKKTTRSTILETLKRQNLDESGRNTIAQGEVARIIHMNGKERRAIIDSVAGIADFEEKKKEAMRELELVETRIREAKLVLGERKAYLDELGKERESAVKYLEAKKTLANAKGTLLKGEIDRYVKDLEAAIRAEHEHNTEKKKFDEEMEKIGNELDAVEKKRHETSEELQSQQKTNALIRKLEELKAACGSNQQLIEDRKAEIEKINSEGEKLGGELVSLEKEISILDKDAGILEKELKAAEKEYSSEAGFVEDENIVKIKAAIEAKEQELSSEKEMLISVTSMIQSKKDILAAKQEQEQAIKTGIGEFEEEKTGSLTEEVKAIAKKIEDSFRKTKEINAEMAELEKKMLEIKERASIYKVRASPGLANPALGFISELKDNGIYGTVAELITFDQKYTSAVEAAGGSRLLYVVVDSVDTATRTIEKLKKAKAGRATFIPMDSVKAPAGIKMNGFSSVLDVVEFPQKIARAAHYLFADTLLVDDAADAKKLGIGSARMVTVDGEIFERSGIVSGGRAQSSILSANQLRKIENELTEVRSTRESLLSELYSLREEESKLRAEKSSVEIKIKTIEMRSQLAKEKLEEQKELIARKQRLAKEAADLETLISGKIAEKEKLEEDVKKRIGEVAKLKEDLAKAEREFSEQSKESSEQRAALSGRVSSLRATIDGKKKEMALRKNELGEKQERIKRIEREKKESAEKIGNVTKQLAKDRKELQETEAKISSTSRKIEALFEKMRGCENEITAIGEKRGKIRIALDKIGREMNQIEIKKATTTTRLEDIRAEFSAFTEFEELEASRDELTKLIGSSETALNTLGNVNMAAIEMYDRKRGEIDGVEERISKLDGEREAILSMISEIEEHKKEAFFETFEAVGDNFKKMFQHVNVGEGHLYMNNPSSPFESGLFIKLRRNNQDHSLDSLSGGEKTLVALMFIFALQLFKPSPFYILDEVDAALDKPNSKNLSDLVTKMGKNSQFIIVSHNDIVMANSDTVIGVTKIGDTSKLVGIKLKQVNA
ncbi:chromosome segregation protein SMC [Candidatus Micrarchaeota archaeon]|nr:chromosome segregation protein SMC [Candidatus Micrarchaeota archaeon]